MKDESRVLEVGCGTGAVLESFKDIASGRNWCFTGVDINIDYLHYAHQSCPSFELTQGDAFCLPFSHGCFDLVFCHFLLLWVKDPAAVLLEMRRVVRPGGWIVAFAEPDYGGRIDEPEELEPIGALQEISLQDQGAETRLGRKLQGLFYKIGLLDVESGVIGAQWRQSSFQSIKDFDLEWEVLRSDLQNSISNGNLEKYQTIDRAARQSGRRILFVPTFYAKGRSPNS